MRGREYNKAVVRRKRRGGVAERKERKSVGKGWGVTYSGNIKEEMLEVARQPSERSYSAKKYIF